IKESRYCTTLAIISLSHFLIIMEFEKLSSDIELEDNENKPENDL
ncbi:10046_t:CDS:1, partial [Diversispora eburnea]